MEIPASTELSPEEQIAYAVCEQLLNNQPGYQAAYSFGTPGGDDLDLRLCFANLETVDQDHVRTQFTAALRAQGVRKDVDLLFMSDQEFQTGIRDLVELGDVEERLTDGFDPHEGQRAVGDTSLFSLYIFATMRPVHRNPAAGELGSPEAALERLRLTYEGAVGWSHFFTAVFVREFLRVAGDPNTDPRYLERLAKCYSRVVAGSTLAQLTQAARDGLKPPLITAIKAAGPALSTDENISNTLMTDEQTAQLLDQESQELLRIAGAIRSGRMTTPPIEFIEAAEAGLFFAAFQQGAERRTPQGEDADALGSFALGELIRGLGTRRTFADGSQLTTQGMLQTDIIYLPLKTQAKSRNNGVRITVRNQDGSNIHYDRGAGRAVGEAALFGLPRSATVTAQGEVEAYVIDANVLKNLLDNPGVHAQLQERTLTTRPARLTDVLLRYLAREAGIFTRQTLPYTTLAAREQAQQQMGNNPLARYNMGQDFRRVLDLFAAAEGTESATGIPVTSIASAEQPRMLFQTGTTNDHLYVVAEGTVNIQLQNGETVTLQPGEYFGESSLLGQPTTGTAVLTPNSRVVAANKTWFTRFSQSRSPLPNDGTVPPDLQRYLPVHLQYHLAAEGYDRVRRRLLTQQK